MFAVQAPNGEQLAVTMPPDVVPGTTFQVIVPPHVLAPPPTVGAASPAVMSSIFATRTAYSAGRAATRRGARGRNTPPSLRLAGLRRR